MVVKIYQDLHKNFLQPRRDDSLFFLKLSSH